MLFVFFEFLDQFSEFSIVTYNSQRKVCVPFINFNYTDYKNTPSSLFKDNWTISSNRIFLSVISLHATSHERERCKEEKRWTLLPRDSGSRCSQAKTTDPCRPSRANTPLSQPHTHTHTHTALCVIRNHEKRRSKRTIRSRRKKLETFLGFFGSTNSFLRPSAIRGIAREEEILRGSRTRAKRNWVCPALEPSFSLFY